MGQLGESKILCSGRYAQKTQISFTLGLGITPKYVIAVVGACSHQCVNHPLYKEGYEMSNEEE